MKRGVIAAGIVATILVMGFANAERLPVVNSDNNDWGNILNRLLNRSIGQNGTVHNASLYYIGDTEHRIELNPGTRFNTIATGGMWIHDEDDHGEGEIIYLLTHLNNTNLWLQSGRNNSFSMVGNSFGLIPNFLGRENFTSGGAVNMSQLSNYVFLCEFFNMTCLYNADTRGRAGATTPGGPLLWTMGDLEVWRTSTIHEGILVFRTANYILGGGAFNIFNGSFIVQTESIQEQGFAENAVITILDKNFDDGVLTPFVQTTSGGGASEWVVVDDDASCHDGLCARAIGGTGNPERIMEANVSTLDITDMNLSFYITTLALNSGDLFNMTVNNNEGSGELTLFSSNNGTNFADVFAFRPVPNSMGNRSEVTLKFLFQANNPIAEQIFIDNILLVGRANESTVVNVTVTDFFEATQTGDTEQTGNHTMINQSAGVQAVQWVDTNGWHLEVTNI